MPNAIDSCRVDLEDWFFDKAEDVQRDNTMTLWRQLQNALRDYQIMSYKYNE